MEKIIVTGGAGFIGSHIVDALIEKGKEVHVIENLAAGKRDHVNKKAQLHVEDIRDVEHITQIMQGASYVFHLAAVPRVQFSIENPRETHEVNATGTLNVLIAAKEAGVKRVIFSSSSSVYGDTDILPIHEELAPHPISPYALHKLIGELYCRLFVDVYQLETVCLRYFNAYGPRMDPDGAYALVVGKFLKMWKAKEPLTITGDGKQTRDFTHVSDIARANILAMESDQVGKGEVINIGAGLGTSVNELAELIGGPVEHIPARLEPHDTKADVSRAKKLLGWEPQLTLQDTIEDLKKGF